MSGYLPSQQKSHKAVHKTVEGSKTTIIKHIKNWLWLSEAAAEMLLYSVLYLNAYVFFLSFFSLDKQIAVGSVVYHLLGSRCLSHKWQGM